ncbi:MAG TPA: 30S ribosomal protein S6 [Vicinamibacterales bacterium]
MSATKQYELVYIAAPETTDEQLAELHEQIASVVSRFGGTIDRTEPWGRRKLAYPIKRHKEGIYVLEVISGGGDLVKELDRRLKVSDLIIRHLIVRVDEDLRIAARAKAKRQETAARRRIARGLPPEPTPEEQMQAVGAPSGTEGGDEAEA